MSRTDLPPPDLASLLSILGDAVSREVVAALEGSGLRHGHGYLVQRLLVGPATATEMAAELGITQQAVSRTVNELVALGHVELTADPLDSRRRPARLTPRGRAAVRRARAARKRLDERVRSEIGDERYDGLVESLELVVVAWGLSDQVSRRTVPPPEGMV